MRDIRFALLTSALLGLALALLRPSWTQPRAAYDLVLVADITGSMNARDYTLDGRPASRLDIVKQRLRELIAKLPCRSRVGLGVFTERRSFLLFQPVELCSSFSAIDGAIASLDWRMAWEGDSHVTSGLYRAIEIARDVGADLVFLTDGHEAPPLPAAGPHAFDGKAGEVRGLVVGVGGSAPAPIPKLDETGREIGFWSMTDVPQENRAGLPPADASSRPGWHPRHAPWGAEAATGSEHLTSVREEHLQQLAERTGLGYVRLAEGLDLERAVATHARERSIQASIDLRPLPAGLALVALIAIYGLVPIVQSLRMKRRQHT
jgi:mxaL protein